MRRFTRLAVAVLLVVLGQWSSGQPARATDVGEWALLTVTAGSGGADVEVLVFVDANPTPGAGPFMFGYGSTYGPYGWVGAYDAGGGPVKATSTNDLGGLDVTVSRSSGGGISFGTGGTLNDLPAGERFSLLLFAANGTLDYFYKQAKVTAGTATIEWTEGAGATALGIVEAGGNGTAVSAASAAAGQTSRTATVTTGIAGAFSGQCIVCSGAWQSPASTSGQWTSAGVPGVLQSFPNGGFAGPAGEWQFSWQGARAAQDGLLSEPGLVAWAPIGEEAASRFATPPPPGWTRPTGPPVEPPAPLVDIAVENGWAAISVDAVAGADFEVGIESTGPSNASAIARGIWADMPSGYGTWSFLSARGAGGSNTTTARAGDMTLVESTDARVTGNSSMTLGMGGGRAGRYRLVVAAAGNEPTPFRFTLQGTGISIAATEVGSNAEMLVGDDFAPVAYAAAGRRVPLAGGATASALVAGSAERTIDDTLFGWFRGSEGSVVAHEGPDRPGFAQSFSNAPAGLYRFHVGAEASALLPTFAFLADVRRPA